MPELLARQPPFESHGSTSRPFLESLYHEIRGAWSQAPLTPSSLWLSFSVLAIISAGSLSVSSALASPSYPVQVWWSFLFWWLWSLPTCPTAAIRLLNSPILLCLSLFSFPGLEPCYQGPQQIHALTFSWTLTPLLGLHSSLTNPPRLPGLSLGSAASALAPFLLHQGQNLHINSEDQSRWMHFSMVMYCPANISSLTLHYSSLGNCIPSPYQADTSIHAINSVPLRSDTINPLLFCMYFTSSPWLLHTDTHAHMCVLFNTPSFHPTTQLDMAHRSSSITFKHI